MLRTAFAASCCLLVLAGCGGSTATTTATTAATVPSGPAGTPVTDAQAVILAKLLQLDYDDGGAHVTGDFPFSSTARVLVDATMDWRHLRGTMIVREPGQAVSQNRTYYWSQKTVLAQKAPGSPDYVASQPNPSGIPAHFLISSLALLSAQNIDNVAVIKDQGSRFLRKDKIGATPVDVYQYGTQGKNEYWVGADGRLDRVVLDVPKLGGSGTLDFTQRGRKRVAFPPAARQEQG